jgi:hypothetical protein
MTQNRNAMGMTPTQIGILAGLAGVACLLFGLTGWLILRRNSGPAAGAPREPLASKSTSTPFAMPTVAPTGTLTPVPYELLIPQGWVQFKTGLIEIWLPAEFKQADPHAFGDLTGLAVPELFMREGESSSSLYQMLVMISYEPLAADSLDVFLDQELTKLPSAVRVAERRKVNVNSTEVVRFVFEIDNDQNVDINDMTYVFLDGSTVWYVEYAAQINEFYEKLSMFEQSAKTFRIVK